MSYLGEAVEYLLDTPAGPVKAQTSPQAPRCAPQQVVRFGLPLAAAVPLEEG